MRITIAHFGTHYVDMPGGVEKLTCYLSSDLVKKGYDVTVLYRDGIEGKPHFPIDSKVRQLNILFENGHKVVSEKLPFTLRVFENWLGFSVRKRRRASMQNLKEDSMVHGSADF